VRNFSFYIAKYLLKSKGIRELQSFIPYGIERASEMFCLLNLLAFQIHSILDVNNEDYQKARAYAGRRDEFFNELRVLMRRNLFESWRQLIVFMYSDPDSG
jgi:hypothetical protein